MKNFLGEPLVHFLLIGAALFLAFEVSKKGTQETPNRIVVSNSEVEQLAAKFERTWMRPPDEEEQAKLIQDYVRNEVCYREAVALGLDRNDPLVRRRMRQKLEFILEDLTEETSPGDGPLGEYLEQHPERFGVEPKVTFHQLYLNPDRRRDLAGDAERLLKELRGGEEPEALGDPSLVKTHFSLATRSEIARQFGDVFAMEVVALEPGDWAGPIRSGLGGHLVKVYERVEGRLPKLDEVRSQVERAWQVQRGKELKDQAFAQLLEGYEIVVEPAPAEDL